MKRIKQKVGTHKDWKFGLITYDVYRDSEDVFIISDTSGEWLEAHVSENDMIKLLNEKLNLLQLKWK